MYIFLNAWNKMIRHLVTSTFVINDDSAAHKRWNEILKKLELTQGKHVMMCIKCESRQTNTELRDSR